MTPRRAWPARLAARASVMLLALGVLMGTPAPAAAQGHAGYCPDDNGVTVVVDFQQLGGGTVVRCATGPQTSGLAALQNAGFSVEGTLRWGLAFVCRINGKPGADTEPCIDTPPASAYWAYWHAPNGGTWTYNQAGGTSRTPPPGSFEGWSFSMDNPPDGNPPPRVPPQRPEPPPPPPTAPATNPAGDSGGARGSDGSSGGNGRSSDGSTKPRGTSAQTGTGQRAHGSDMAGPAAAGSSGPGRAEVSGRNGSHSPTPAPQPAHGTAAEDPARPWHGLGSESELTSHEVPQQAAPSSGGTPAATVVSVALVAALLGGATWMFRRHRRS